jgi:hypothetical protein
MKKTNFLTLSHDYQMDKTSVLGKGSTGEVYLGTPLLLLRKSSLFQPTCRHQINPTWNHW